MENIYRDGFIFYFKNSFETIKQVSFNKAVYPILVLVAFFLLGSNQLRAQLPTEFEKQDLVTGLGNATTFKIAPDGRIFILDRYGELIIYKPDTQTTVTAGNLSVFHELEDGLLGIAFDPDFENNGYIYLHYSPLSTTVNRVSRFLMEGDDLNLGSEAILLDWPTQRDEYYHAGGDMGFDSQGNLYIATGDNSNHSAYAAVNENDENQSSENTSSNTNDLRGKILRITPQSNGTYTIPNGNLFPVGMANTRPEIYVMGARNPYRMHVDAEFDDWVFWGEVGPDSDLDGTNGEGPVGLDEINLVKEAGNYGWPYFSGNGINDANTVGGQDDSAQYAYLINYLSPPGYYDPATPQNNSVWNTGIVDLPPAQPAWIDFFHRAYMAGPRYKFDNSLSDLQRLPVEFDGLFFFYDFNKSLVWTVQMDADGNILSIDQLSPSVFGESSDGFIDMEIGPDGFLYILAYGAGCCPDNVGTGRLIKVIYTGITSNAPPNAVVSVDVTNGSLPLTVNFSSAGTSDPNGDTPLTYEWDFDTEGGASVDSTDENPTHIYTVEGVYNAQVRVSDGNGGIGVANITINAGNNSTQFTFNSPIDGGFINWGDDIEIDLFTSDIEDGDTDGNPGTTGSGINCADVNVVPSLGHLTHFHDTPAINGCPQTITLDAEGHQVNGEADLFFVLGANYTDAGGLQSFDQIRLYPKRAEAEHYDAESGVEVIQNTDLSGGGEEAIRVDHNSYIVLEGRNLTNITGVRYRVAAASSGSSIELRLGSPSGTLLATSNIPSTGGLSNWVNVDETFTDPGTKNDLYFVFTKNLGQENIFDLNYIEFLGAGVSTDNSAPEVSEIKSINTTQVQVTYNEVVTAITAEDLTNYTIDSGVTISTAELQENERSVVLTMSQLSPDIEYNLTIRNVQNSAGLTIVTDSYPFSIFDPVRINSGGLEVTASLGTFTADEFFVNGDSFPNNIPIANTLDDELYQTERFNNGDLIYEIPILVSGEYDIRLHFAEIFHGVGTNPGGVGSRIFNVSIEEQEVLSSFDILSETNPATALIKEFDNVLIADGRATIQLSSIVGDAKISAIEILSRDAFDAVPSISILSPQEGWDVNQPFEVSFSTRNWDIAVGSTHMHYYIDGMMIGPHYSYGPIEIDGLTEGQHTIRLELFNANHTGTGVFDEVTVNVTNALVCNDLPFPDEWEVHELEQDELPHRSVYIYADDDLDGDGLKDIVTGAWWYKNPGTASGNWVRNTIGAPFNNVAHVYDFDGDGDMDLLGTQGAYVGAGMAWAENDGSGNFTVRTNIPDGSTTYSEIFLAGIAGGFFDGGSEYQMAINWNGAESSGSAVQLLRVPADPINTTWTFETLSPDSLGEDINAGDIDDDGDLDLFQGGNWLENDLNNTGNWITHNIAAVDYVTTVDRNQLADFDRDGDLDGVIGQLGLGSNPDRYQFAWFEAPDDPTQNWTKNIIDSDVQGSLSVVTADIDFDGDQDVIVGEWLGNNELFGFENDLCNSGTWIKHTIDAGGTGFDHHDGTQVVDIDNDGDLDIISIGWDNIIPRIFENTTINGSDPINLAPIVANPGLQIYNEGDDVSIQVVANDPNALDVLAYSATNLPVNLSIDPSTGLISGTLGVTSGDYLVTVRATDEEGLFDEETFTITIGDFESLLRINAGGPELTFGAEEWSADQLFIGGSVFSDSTPEAIENTDNDELFHTERFTDTGSMGYEIPVSQAGSYGVRLYFAEIFYTNTGLRVFDVDLENGQGELIDYDIVQVAGGANIAVVENFVLNVTDGAISINLTSNIENAKISAIEILGPGTNFPPDVINPGDQTYFSESNVDLQIEANDLGDTLTYTATGLPSDLTIDANTGLISGILMGGPADYSITVRATDEEGLFDEETFTISVVDFPAQLSINAGGPTFIFDSIEWIADQYFVGGFDDFSVTNTIDNTNNDELYQTERYAGSGELSYEIPVPNNFEYEVRLHFAELFFGANGNPGGVGSRVFDVDVENGQGVLNDYDITVEAGGPLTAIVESFIVTVNDGTLNIVFANEANSAKISGIEVIKRESPIAVVQATPLSGDAPLEVMFTGNNSTDDVAIVSYTWNFDDGVGSSTEANPTYTFTEAGVYNVQLTVTDNLGLTDTETVTITVEEPNQPPVAVIEATPESGPAPLEVMFTGSNSTDDGSIVSYVWDFGDDQGTSSEANPSYTFTEVGVYEVELIVTDDEGLTGTETISIVVSSPENDPPVAVAEANPTEGNAPLPVIFDASNSTDDNEIVSYFWDFKNGTTSSEVNPVTNFDMVGTYLVELTVTDEEGLTDTDIVEITVTDGEAPVAIVTATPLSGDAPLEVMFTGENSTDNVGIVSYSWNFGDGVGTSTDINPTYVFNTMGVYNVVLTVADDEGLTDTESITITVSDPSINDAPVAIASADPLESVAPATINFVGSNSTDDKGVVSYLWNFGDDSSSTDQDPSHEYGFAGTFEVTLTVEDLEGLTDTAELTIVIVDNDALSVDSMAVIVQNPTKDIATVQLVDMPDDMVVTEIGLHDSSGRLMGSYTPQQLFVDDRYEIPVRTLRDGLYYITLEFNTGDPIVLRLLVKN